MLIVSNAGCSVGLPAIVADAHANAHAGGPKADAGTRTLIPVTIVAAFDEAVARHGIVGIPNDHAAAATGVKASTAVIANQPNWLQQIRICVFAAGIDVRSICAPNKQRASACQQRDGEFPHEFLRANSALWLKPCRSFSFPANLELG